MLSAQQTQKLDLGIIRGWNYDAWHLHRSWIELKTNNKRIHVEHNTSCTEVLCCFKGMFDSREPKNKPN